MPTQEAKAHHVGEWASLRNTSPEIAEAILKSRIMTKLAEKFGKKVAMRCSSKPLRKQTKIRSFGVNRLSNAKRLAL